MATTGTYLADPNLATYVDEAVERAGVDLQEIGTQHIISIRRSVGFVLSRWSNKGHRQWTFEQVSQAPTSIGQTFFDLPFGTIDVQSVVLRRNGVDTEMYPISRHDYLIIHDKSLPGRPDRYFIDRRRDTDASTRMQMFFWLAAENLTDRIIFNAYKQIQDPGNAQNTLDIPFRFQEAFVAALAAKVSEKYTPDRFDRLAAYAEATFKEADDEDHESAPMVISVGYDRFYGRR